MLTVTPMFSCRVQQILGQKGRLYHKAGSDKSEYYNTTASLETVILDYVV